MTGEAMASPLGFLAAGGLLGIVASMWSKIKGLAWRLLGTFVQRVELQNISNHNAVIGYLIKNHKRSRNYDRVYSATWDYQRDSQYALIPAELFGTKTMIFWHGWVPFLFTVQGQAEAAPTSGGSPPGSRTESSNESKAISCLTFIRGTVDVDRLIGNACKAVNERTWKTYRAVLNQETRFDIHYIPPRNNNKCLGRGESGQTADVPWYRQDHFRLIDRKPEQLGLPPVQSGSALGNLIFPKRVMEVIREVELWSKSRDWYRDKAIPWKRGLLLYGIPGTGKTALARAFAEDLNLPIFIFSLGELDNALMTEAWDTMQRVTPCIALIEDIDNVFHGRENITRKLSGGYGTITVNSSSDDRKSDHFGEPKVAARRGMLSFDCLLNCIDGVARSEGIFTIITTNDLSKLDPAIGQPRSRPDGSVDFISTRPGRIDKAVELSYLEPEDKKRMAARILGEFEEAHLQMAVSIDQEPDRLETPAQFQERCAQIALKCYWTQTRTEPAAKTAQVC